MFLSPVGVVKHVNRDVSRLVIYPEYCRGVEGLDQYSHIIILYWLHLRDDKKHRRVLHVSLMGGKAGYEAGVFASRSPSRPNPVGFCVVKLLKVEGCDLLVKGLDASEGSPLIDIKPYIPDSDSIPYARYPPLRKSNLKE